MRRLLDKVNNLTNSTHSSILDHGLNTSHFQIDLNSVIEEDAVGENVPQSYLNLSNNRGRKSNVSPID